MKLRSTFTGLLLVATIMMACKKEVDLSPTDLLTQHDWKATSITRQTPPAATPTETFLNFQDCVKDDVYAFRKDNVFLRLEGKSRCNPADPLVQSSTTWNISVDGETLHIGDGPNHIIKLTGDSLVYQVENIGAEIRIIRYAKN